MRLVRPTSFACVLLAAAAALPSQARQASDHPLIGTWTWQPEGKSCTEVYEWHADGTGLVTSGEEVTETRFQISKMPDRNGFYVFLDRVVKDNRGRDCAGSTKDDTGRKTTLYIQMSPDGDQIRICLKATGAACFGPLTRMPDLEI